MIDEQEIAIVGGGNGGLTLLADLTRRGLPARLFDFPEFAAPLQPIRARLALDVQDGSGEHTVRLRTEQVGTSAEVALEDATVVFVVVPAFAIRYAGQAIAPWLKPGMIVALSPSTGPSLEMAEVWRGLGVGQGTRLVETLSLPYACRRTGPTRLLVSGVKRILPVAALPAVDTAEAVERLRRILPQIEPAADVLETSLNNLNVIAHPAPTLFNLSLVEYGRGRHEHYSDIAITPTVGRVMESLDAERVGLARALGVRAPTTVEMMWRLYGLEGRDIRDVLTHSRVHLGTGGPGSLEHRYVTEDVAYGLVPMCVWADMVGHPVATMRQIVDVAGLLTGRDLRAAGRNRARMGLAARGGADDLLRVVGRGPRA